MSLLVSVTMSWVLISFGVITIFDNVLVGFAFPFLTAGLMKLSHLLLTRHRPLTQDPQHFAIQESIVIGGLLAVILALSWGSQLTLSELAYGGGAMAVLSILSMAFEEFWVAREWRAAQRAKLDMERAKRLAQDGELGVADEMLREALLTTELAFGSHHPQVASIVTELAEITSALGRVAPSTLLFKRAVEIRETLQPWDGDFVIALKRYVEHLRQNGLLTEALPLASWAVVVSRRVHGDQVATADAILALAKINTGLGKIPQAYKSCRSASQILENRLGRNHRQTQKAKARMASHAVTLGRTAEAQRLLSEVMSARQRLRDGDSHDADDLNVLLDLIRVYQQHDPKRALEFRAQAIALFRSTVGPSYERAEEVLATLPAYLAQGITPALEQLYTVLFRGDTYEARQSLRDSPDLARIVDRSDWTPLQWASFFGLAEVVTLLMSQGADLEHGAGNDYPALYVAARWGRHRVVSDMAQKGEDIDLNILCSDGSRPIHGAVRSGHHLTLEILLSRKARLDVTNDRGWTPLHEAAFTGHRKFVVQLISEGVDINAQVGPSFDTPLHAAVMGDSALAAETLVLNLVDVQLKNAKGLTPLQLAIDLGHLNVTKVLEAYQDKSSTPTVRANALTEVGAV